MDSSTSTDDLSTTDIEVCVLTSVNKKKRDLLAWIKDSRSSLDFVHSHIATLLHSNPDLQTSVNHLASKCFSQISHVWKYSCWLNPFQKIVQRDKSLIALCVIWVIQCSKSPNPKIPSVIKFKGFPAFLTCETPPGIDRCVRSAVCTRRRDRRQDRERPAAMCMNTLQQRSLRDNKLIMSDLYPLHPPPLSHPYRPRISAHSGSAVPDHPHKCWALKSERAGRYNLTRVASEQSARLIRS